MISLTILRDYFKQTIDIGGNNQLIMINHDLQSCTCTNQFYLFFFLQKPNITIIRKLTQLYDIITVKEPHIFCVLQWVEKDFFLIIENS